MEGSIRLHLGAGHYYWPGFINHDSEVDLKDLPYKDGSVSAIYSVHMFEHLPRLEVDQFLQEWRRILKDGGKLVMEMPSLDKMARLIVSGSKSPRLTTFGIFGDPRDWDDRPLMRHEWSWTNHELKSVLEANGFACEIKEPVYHIKERDLRVEARKV